MTRIHHYDTTYEQEAEDGTVTASVKLRIYYTVTWCREATRDEPGYGDTAELQGVSVEIRSTGKYRDLYPGKGPPENETFFVGPKRSLTITKPN